VAKVAVVGNVAVDRIDGRPPTAGGCPVFAALALRMLRREAQIIARYAPSDGVLVEPVLQVPGVVVTPVPAQTTTAFGFRYHGERREMTVEAIGEPWSPADVEALDADVTWVHVAPLLRSDFPSQTLAALAGASRTVSYDGQGLVRVPQLGPMRVDARFDAALLASLSVLKLAEDEAAVVACGRFDREHARRLGVPEILVTHGSNGCTLYLDGETRHVPAAWRVLGVQTTGAGDVFMVGYAVARSEGEDPQRACARASELVARMLEERKRASLREHAATTSEDD
jgi:sugar/nucleoside kinase (ribokinase family)